MFFYTKYTQATVEAVVVGYITELGEDEEFSSVKTIPLLVSIIKVFYITLLMFKLPVTLVKKTLGLVPCDEADDSITEAWIMNTLLQALSFYEWRSLEEVWRRIKDETKIPNLLKEEPEMKRKGIIFMFLLIFTYMGLFKVRFENKEEFIAHRLLTDPSEDLQEKAELDKEYEELTQLSHYKRIYMGMRMLFQRNPVGDKRPKVSKMLTSMTYGLSK